MDIPIRLKSRVRNVVDRTTGALGFRLVRADRWSLRPTLDSTLDVNLHSSGWQAPGDAVEYLRSDNPRLLQLRRDYGQLDWPVRDHSRWEDDKVRAFLNLGYFRGDNIIIWHYRDGTSRTELLYYVFLRYTLDQGGGELLEKLGEDGAFGCWTYSFPGQPPCSRDLLDSVNELMFLDRQMSVLSSPGLRVLEIGAGYGRLAYRFTQAVPDVADYCCVDAVAESTFLCEFYTGFRKVTPPVRVSPLTAVPSLAPGAFDLAINVHSFSECSLAAIDWWMAQLERLGIRRLFLVPNEPEGFLSTEPDGTRLDYLPTIEGHGFELTVEEHVLRDEAVRSLLDVRDRFCIFDSAR